MARTTQALVGALLGNATVDSVADWDGVRSLTPFIDSATVVVDRVATCATRKGITLTSTELELIERWWAAHLYTKSDPTYASKTTAEASASFVRDPQVPEPYKDGAYSLDYSGCLKAIASGARAGAAWLGRKRSDQTDYVDRS